MSQIVHFELRAGDADRAKRFWGGLFGWQLAPWEGGPEYHMTETGGGPGRAI